MFNPRTEPDTATVAAIVQDRIDTTWDALRGWLDARGTDNWDDDAQQIYDDAVASADRCYDFLRDLLNGGN